MKLFFILRESIRNYEWTTRLKLVWLPMLCALGLGITLVFFMHDQFDYEKTNKLSFCLPLFFAASFFFTSAIQFSRIKNSLIVIAVGIVAIAADCYFWLYRQGDNIGLETGIGHVAVYSTLFISFFVIPTFRHKNDTTLIRFAGDTITTSALLFLATILATGAISLLILLLEQLFSINTNHFITYIWTFNSTALFCSMIVLTIPMVGERGMATDFAEKIAVKLGKFIFLPILFLYLIVLYIYIAKIVVSWQLPDGMVTYLTAGVIIELLAVECLLYSKLNNTDASRLWLLLRRILPLIVLPAVVLMSIGIARRVSDYGWTVSRLYVLGINVWSYITVIALFISTFRKFKAMTWIVSAFFGLFLLVSVIPGTNFVSITKRILISDIEQLIDKANPKYPGHVLNKYEMLAWCESLPYDQAEPIVSKMAYLADHYDKQSVSRWVAYKEDEFVVREFNLHQDDVQPKNYISFYFETPNNGFITIPEGYTKVMYSLRCECVERRDNGIVVIDIFFGNNESTDKVRVAIDTKAEYGDFITVNSNKGVKIILLRLHIVMDYDNERYNSNCDGYVFTK